MSETRDRAQEVADAIWHYRDELPEGSDWLWYAVNVIAEADPDMTVGELHRAIGILRAREMAHGCAPAPLIVQ